MIELRNVCKGFGGRRVLDGVSFDVGDKEFVSIVGPSGCGKTTLLRIIAGLASPDSGSVLVEGEPPERAREKKAFGLVPQNDCLLPWRNVAENVGLPLEIILDGAFRKERISELLELVELGAFGESYPHELSRGMRERVAIARALSFEPKILLMDEPFASLDALLRERMNLELLRVLRHENGTASSIVFVTHSLREAVFLSDRVIVLSPRPATVAGSERIRLPERRTIELRDCETVSQTVRRLKKSFFSCGKKTLEKDESINSQYDENFIGGRAQ
jgi:NitT/TauT family transport system ATP-binding protein